MRLKAPNLNQSFFRLGNVEIIESLTGFVVKLDDVEILAHSFEYPLMTIGHGTFEAKEHLGNFELSDVIDLEYQLTEWKIGQFSNFKIQHCSLIR